MIRVEIKSSDVRTKSGVSAKTGKPYSIREQDGYAFTHGRDGKLNPYPVRLRISLGDDQAAYEPGNYMLCPSSLYTNRFDQLEVSPVLIPEASTARKAA